MVRLILIIYFLTLFYSCGGKSYVIPKNPQSTSEEQIIPPFSPQCGEEECIKE